MRRPPWWLVAVGGAAAAVAIAAVWLRGPATPAGPVMTPCERAVRDGEHRRAVALCLVRFARTRSEVDLSWAAQAHMYLDELDEAERLARGLLGGPLEGEGHRILSYILLRRGRAEAARAHAGFAIASYRRAGDERRLTSAAVMLAQAAWKAGDFTASLDAADEALALARRWRDPRSEVAAHLARADALRRMGDARGADAALASALDRADTPCEQAWIHLKRGMCQIELGQEGLAMVELARSSQANDRCRSADVSLAIAANRALLLRWRDPAAALDELAAIERAKGEVLETSLMRGYLAADRGALEEADRCFARAAEAAPPDADWPWEIARARGELAELRGGMFGALRAEHHYRRAIAMIAALRSSARARSAHLVSSHRGPYDDLIGLLARAGRWRDVLAVILELDASDMLRATAADAATRDPAQIDLPAPDPAGAGELAGSPSVDDVLAAWDGRDLAIAIAPSRGRIGPGRERAYRLRLAGGRVTGEDVGGAAEARQQADALFADPGDGAAARALGRAIVPPDRSGDTLHVLAIGPLGKVPLAALRDEGGALILARRPLARVLALRARGPEARGEEPPVVIADPRGDLPGAAAEGAEVARALGAAARVFGSRTDSPATRDGLWVARRAAVLHIAAHIADRGRWRALRLADGDVDPAEIVRRGLAPRLAVLASCGSAAAMDTEGWGSIASALLEAGTAAVIATDRAVGDAAARSVMRDFYAQPDWREDPARALARVQQALDARARSAGAALAGGDAAEPRRWAAFSVLRRPPVIHAPPAPRRSRDAP
jgi:tetratricopeptide (TPR) repeat protein